MIDKTVTLSGKQLELYIRVLEKDVEEQASIIGSKEEELNLLKSKYESDLNLLSELTGNSRSIIAEHISLDEFSYDPDWSLIQKVQYVLNLEKVPLPVREIAIRLVEIEPRIKGDRSDQVFKTVIAASLGNYAKDGQIFFKNDRDFPNKYGLLEWRGKALLNALK